MTGAQDIDRLAMLLARLPGLGPRSARRAVLHLLRHRETLLHPLMRQLAEVDERLGVCAICGAIDTAQPCRVCADPERDATLMCVVADTADLWAIERGGRFRGRYHVLGGLLSAFDGVGPERLSLARLLERLGEGVGELVLAFPATLEGQTTAHWLADRLADRVAAGLSLTRLAQGVPIGGELDWLDDGTLGEALRLRRPV